MITIPRTLAARLTAVLHQGMPSAPRPGGRAPVRLESGPGGLVLRAQTGDLAVELRDARPGPEARLWLPAAALADFQGKGAAPVVLEPGDSGVVRAHWDEGGSPRARLYAAPIGADASPFPVEPERLARAPRGLADALVAAAQTAARPGTDPVLARWLFSGRGELVSCDGVQLLVQGGLTFPWRGDLLVAALPVGVARRLAGGRLRWGKGARHLCLRRGAWSFHLAFADPADYPAAAGLLPCTGGAATRLRLAPADAALLARALPLLCRGRLEDEPLTLELDGHLVVHTGTAGREGSCTLALRQSCVLGPPLRLRTAHSYLLRAVRLGFRELTVGTPQGPVVCRQGRRSYVWMPLGGGTAPAEPGSP